MVELPERDDRRPSHAVIETIAELDGVEITAITPPEYEPLYSVVDTDALDALFASTGRTGERVGRVEFEYAGYEVTVYSDGRVEATDADEPSRSSDSSGHVHQ